MSGGSTEGSQSRTGRSLQLLEVRRTWRGRWDMDAIQDRERAELGLFYIIGFNVWVGNGPFTIGGNTGENLSLKGTGERIR